jgi:hypothetical protein
MMMMNVDIQFSIIVKDNHLIHDYNHVYQLILSNPTKILTNDRERLNLHINVSFAMLSRRDNREVYCQLLHKVFRNIDDSMSRLHLIDSKDK